MCRQAEFRQGSQAGAKSAVFEVQGGVCGAGSFVEAKTAADLTGATVAHVKPIC